MVPYLPSLISKGTSLDCHVWIEESAHWIANMEEEEPGAQARPVKWNCLDLTPLFPHRRVPLYVLTPETPPYTPPCQQPLGCHRSSPSADLFLTDE